MKLMLSFNRCPSHGYESISVDAIEKDGSGSGLRLTDGKCCGRFDTVRSFPVTVATLKDALEFAERCVPAVHHSEEKKA